MKVYHISTNRQHFNHEKELNFIKFDNKCIMLPLFTVSRMCAE